MKTIRASEIGVYLYCQRAWWYQRQGIQTENLEDIIGGIELHQRHERAVVVSGCTQALAFLLLLVALALATFFLVSRFL